VTHRSNAGEVFIRRQLSRAVGALTIAGIVSIMVGQQPGSRRPEADATPARQIFAVNCAACHGLDGSGTERAPNVVSGVSVEKLSSADILRIVSDGVPGTGMPSFRSLGEERLKAIVGYLRDLEGKNNATRLSGSPEHGKAIFFGKGGCAACHMIAGSGGFIAPDLTTYAQSHSPERIQAAITDPASRDSSTTMVMVTTADSREYRGIVRNEDNFSLQLQTIDGSFHFFNKSALKRIDRETASFMPSDYGSKLNAAELNDLVSYLLSLADSHPARVEHNDEE
jgi:cytochrome c oxidase cbb3-type subunit III